jgi:hypothetical protein
MNSSDIKEDKSLYSYYSVVQMAMSGAHPRPHPHPRSIVRIKYDSVKSKCLPLTSCT